MTDIIERLRAAAEDNTITLRHLNVTPQDTIWWEAANEIEHLRGAAEAALDFIAGLPIEFRDTSRDQCEADLRLALPEQPKN